MKKGKVYIAGAGSGDIGCLTLKVKDIIQKADVILYDNLISNEIISLSSKEALLIDVGKISGFHKVNQEDINSLLIKYSKEYDTVLRLKGGDPFVFGRGAEEAEALFENGIDFEIMQGVSSVTSVPESFGIPITHRDYASSFFVITAHKKNGELSEEEYKKIADLDNTTLIFMMSVKKSDTIAKNLIKAGKDENTKVAIISNGTLSNAKKYEYTLKSLSELQDTDIFEMPGMMVVGEVVALSQKLNTSDKKTLSKKRIIINVPKEKGNRLENMLYFLGAEVLNLSTNYLEKKYDEYEIKKELLKDNFYEYICFTSTYSVDIFFEILRDINIDIRKLINYKICAVGKSTADAIKKYRIIADIIPDEYNAKALSKKLIESGADNILCILPHNIDSELYDSLLSNNIKCRRIDIYEKKLGKVRIYNERYDDIYAFTSSSSVIGLVNSYEKFHFKDKLAFCIGEKTAKTASDNGFKTIISQKSTIEELVKTIADYEKNL